MIKNFLLLLSVTVLSGCTLLDAYLMTKYDPNEYLLISQIRVNAEKFKHDCNDIDKSFDNSKKILEQTKLFVAYSQYIPRNKNVISASEELNGMAQGFVDQYEKTKKVSGPFCKIKYEAIEKSSEKIQRIIGGRPR